jgi:hypothetical protein
MISAVVTAIIAAIQVALLLPAFQAAWEAARRTRCRDHLHAIVLALQQYHDQYKKYPPAYVADAEGRRLHSWRVLILRELGYESLYARYRLDEPWDSPHNRALIAEMPAEFSCPCDSSKAPGVTNYVAIVGCQTIWPAPLSGDFMHAESGMSSVLQVIESCDLQVPWTEPRDVTFREYLRGVNPDDHPSFSSRHPGGALAATMDGEVQFVAQTMDRRIYRRIATTGGGLWPGAPCDAPVEYADDHPLMLQHATQLKQTDVLPVLDAPLAAGRNVVYCSTFQMVWDNLRDALGVDSLQFREARPLATKLNAQRFPREALSGESYVALAGPTSDGVGNRFVAARQQKFPNATLPPLQSVPDLALEAYCYLQKRLPFKVKFNKLDEPLQFQTPEGVRPVRSWGRQAGRELYSERPPSGAPEDPRGQVCILNYVDDQDFILQVQTLSDLIVLAKVTPPATLEETWRMVADRVRNRRIRGMRAALFNNEPLIVPHMALFVERDYDEVTGVPVENVGGKLPLQAAKQYIRFQLDESGAVLESEARAMFASIDDDPDRPPDRPRQFVFDRPFLLALRQPQAESPYFVMWVANTELLIPADHGTVATRGVTTNAGGDAPADRYSPEKQGPSSDGLDGRQPADLGTGRTRALVLRCLAILVCGVLVALLLNKLQRQLGAKQRTPA